MNHMKMFSSTILVSLFLLLVFWFVAMKTGNDEAFIRRRHNLIEKSFDAIDANLSRPLTLKADAPAIDVTSLAPDLTGRRELQHVRFYLAMTNDGPLLAAVQKGAELSEVLRTKSVAYDPSNGTSSEGGLVRVLNNQEHEN